VRANRSLAIDASGGPTLRAPAPDGRRDAADGRCRACWEGDDTCPACVQRGAYALRVIGDGHGIAEAARRLRLPQEHVEDLVAQARDRRDVRSFDQRPLLADAQWFVAYELARDPELTRAEIAHRMKPPMHRADFDRALGYAGTRGRPRRFISVTMGSRLMLALGRAPRELDGC
jgi:hypothetical protein